MKIHSEFYKIKSELKKKYETELLALKAELEEKMLKELAELEEKKLREHMEMKMTKKMGKYLDKLESEREKRLKKYSKMKSNEEKYKTYLESQKRYREKRKRIKEQKDYDYLMEQIGENRYGVVDVGEKKYYVTSNGQFFKSNGVELTGTRKPTGYVSVTLGCKTYSAHRLIWEVFNGKIPEGMEIDHINTIRYDNRLENLRIRTHKENCNNPLSIENYKKHNKEVDRSYLRKKVV